MSVVHSDDDRRRAVDLYLQKNRTVEQIATEVGASRSSIYTWLRESGISGGRQRLTTRAATPRGGASAAELSDQVTEILDNQQRFAMDIDRMTAALAALRAEQDSSAGGWMQQLNEARRALDMNRSSLDLLNATVARLTGAVETLVAMQRPEAPKPEPPARRPPGQK